MFLIYLKKLLLVILVSIIISILGSIIGYWVFEADWPFIPVPILAGALMSLIQKENKSWKFIDKLLIGSLVFGFLLIFLISLRIYLTIHPAKPNLPLIIFNQKDFITLSLVFSFISFLSGLFGIVIKGLTSLIKKRSN